MGLDIAEMMIAIEEEFDVDILEGDAQRLETVGDLIDYLSGKLLPASISEQEAEQLRAAGRQRVHVYLHESQHIANDLLHEETRLEHIFPEAATRYNAWEELRKSLSQDIPALHCSRAHTVNECS